MELCEQGFLGGVAKMKVYVPPNFQNVSLLSIIIYLASIVTPFYSFSIPHIEIFFNPSSGGRRVCVGSAYSGYGGI